MKKIVIFLFNVILLSFISHAQAGYTYNKLGNIYYVDNQGAIVWVMHVGNDENPVLSLNKRGVMFVSNTHNKVPDACGFAAGMDYAQDILIYDVMTKHKEILVKHDFASCQDPKKLVFDPSELQLSPDGKTLYFLTSAWTLSRALHAVDIDGKHLRFVTAAKEYQVVLAGRYTGDLIVTQHRYHDEGGSYDWDWLFTPSGKQVKLYTKEE